MIGTIKDDLELDIIAIFKEVEKRANVLASGKSKNIIEDKESILAAGELASSLIIGKFIPDMLLVDPRELIKAAPGVYFPDVDFATTNKMVRSAFKDLEGMALMPGFIAGGDKGETVTLGRGGSIQLQ